MTRTGQCLCGAVKFRATLESATFLACHCVQCQRWTGGGPLHSIGVTEIAFEDTSSIGAYRASEWGERAFCATCGSTLYWKMQDKPVTSVAVGLLDDQSGLSVAEEIFVDRRADWCQVWPGASQSTEADQFAKFDDYLKAEGKL